MDGSLITSKKTVLWLVPILITVHNLEEAVFMPAVLARRNSAVPNLLHGLVPPITYGQFLLALLIMTAIPYLIGWFAIRERDRVGPGLLLLVSVQVMMLVNVFAHEGIAILIGGYAPGLGHSYSHQSAFLNTPATSCCKGKMGEPKGNGVDCSDRIGFTWNWAPYDNNSLWENSEWSLAQHLSSEVPLTRSLTALFGAPNGDSACAQGHSPLIA